LKNNSATRKVPIHSKLIGLGLLGFVKKIKKNGMLFQELFDEGGNHYKKFGNSFNRKEKSGWSSNVQ
jgi:hypothetical protein